MSPSPPSLLHHPPQVTPDFPLGRESSLLPSPESLSATGVARVCVFSVGLMAAQSPWIVTLWHCDIVSALWTIWWLSWWLSGSARNQPQQRGLCCGQTVSPGKTKGTQESSDSTRERSPAMWVYKYNNPFPWVSGSDFPRTWRPWILVTREASRPTVNWSRVKVDWSYRRDQGRKLLTPGRSVGPAGWSELKVAR